MTTQASTTQPGLRSRSPCNAPIIQACSGNGAEGCGIEGDIDSVEIWIDPMNPGEFLVLPDWDGTTVCSATEEPEPGVIQDQEDCAAIPLAPGVGGSCTLTNTRFYEGIPTLSQYGLMLLSLLMLGMGCIRFQAIHLKTVAAEAAPTGRTIVGADLSATIRDHKVTPTI